MYIQFIPVICLILRKVKKFQIVAIGLAPLPVVLDMLHFRFLIKLYIFYFVYGNK